MDILALTIAAIVCGALAGALWWLSRQRLDRDEEEWRDVASDAGLIYHPRRRPFGPRITGPFEGGMDVDFVLEDATDSSLPVRLRVLTGRAHGHEAGPCVGDVLAELPDGDGHLGPLVETAGVVEAHLRADMLELRCDGRLDGQLARELLRAALRAVAPLARAGRKA